MSDPTKNQSVQSGSFETGRSKGDTSKRKARRVSPRRELAVVTLGAVAAITGLSGFLAANPPSWAIASETATQETTSEAASPAEQSGTDVGPAPANLKPAPVQEWAEAPQPSVEEAPPAWSAPSREPAATESRGS